MTYIAMIFIPVLLIMPRAFQQLAHEDYTSFYLVLFMGFCFFIFLWFFFTFMFSKQVKDFRRYFDCILKSLDHTNEPRENELLRVLGK